MPADDPGSGLVLSLLYMLLTFRCPGFRLIAALMLVLSGLGQATADAESVPGKGSETDVGAAILLRIDGAIGPATSDYVRRGIENAAQQGAAIVVLEMDTPGGLDSSMRDVIKAILASPVPVASFVYPSGSRAASAGTYILYASHVAAMAPGTNLGAATPVPVGGSRPKPASGPAGAGEDESGAGDTPADKDGSAAAPAGDASMAKAVNDAVAYIRSLAEMRDRNVDWAESAVREAASLPAEEALDLGVIDLIASDVPGLLTAVDGRTVETVIGMVELHTAGALMERVNPDWRTELLAVITNPTVAYLLLLVGLYGLLFEGYNPGAILPGVAGAICLLLAAYAFQILPVNYAGLGLIALGIILMISEAFVPSFGALGIGGVIAFVSGSVILMDTEVPGFGVPLALIGSIALLGSLLVMATVWLAVRARRRPVVSGVEELIGAQAEAVGAFEHEGQVFVHGETWSARSAQPVAARQALKVTAVEGLTLTVQPIDKLEH